MSDGDNAQLIGEAKRRLEMAFHGVSIFKRPTPFIKQGKLVFVQADAVTFEVSGHTATVTGLWRAKPVWEIKLIYFLGCIITVQHIDLKMRVQVTD